MPKIITYGTLKHGHLNEPLLADQKFLGKCVTAEPNFKLYEIHGNFTFPALVEVAEGGYQVYGELYEVSEKCLTVLDRLEGVSVGLYARTHIKVLLPDGQSEENVIAYKFLRHSGTDKHVGAVWPIHELPRYRLLGHKYEQEEKEIAFDGVALWNKHLNEWATTAFENEDALRARCMAKRGRYGVRNGSMEPWSLKWFEPRARKGTKEISFYRIVTDNLPSAWFDNRQRLLEWAAENLRFFGGLAGSADEWATALAGCKD